MDTSTTTFSVTLRCSDIHPQICGNDADLCGPNVEGVRFLLLCMCASRCMNNPSLTAVQLLALMGLGFLQGLYALDAADGQTDAPSKVPTRAMLDPIVLSH